MLVVMIKPVAATFLCLVSLVSFSSAQADTPLEMSMKHIAKAYHQLALDLKAPQDASKQDYLDLAAKMKTEVQTSRGLVPKKVAALPADQQAAMITAYQKSMDDLGAAIDTLTADLQAGQWDAALKQIDVIKQKEDAGHKQFRNHDKGGAPAPAPAATTNAPAATTPPATPMQ